MAKINIKFNNKSYQIEESAFNAAIAELQSHLSTVMSGEGATIELGGTAYSVDSVKLSTAKDDFVVHLGTISGEGSSVVVNGVAYSVDSTKIQDSVSGLEAVLGGLQSDNNGSDSTDSKLNQYGFYFGVPYSSIDADGAKNSCVFYEDGGMQGSMTTALSADTCAYKQYEILAGGETAFTVSADGTQITSVGSGAVYTLEVNSSSDNLVQSEYGLYFGEKYSVIHDDGAKESLIFYEDGSVQVIVGSLHPAGTLTYEQYEILFEGATAFTVSADGTQITSTADGTVLTLENSGNEGDTTEVDIFPLQTVEGFVEAPSFAGVYYTVGGITPFELNEGETYYVEWDGETYECECAAGTFNESSFIYLGDGSKFGYEGNNEPFVIAHFSQQGTYLAYAFNDTATSHNIRIYQKVTNTEERLEGDGAEFHSLAPSTLSFRSSAPLNELKSVQIDGETVDPSNYTLEEGSTIVTFPIDYLKNFGKGSYEVTVESENSSAKGDFYVITPELNEYGFYYNQPYYALVESLDGYPYVFLLKEGGVGELMHVLLGTNSAFTYTVENGAILFDAGEGITYTGNVVENGIYIEELDTTFLLDIDKVASDDEYLYLYNGTTGYAVKAIDHSKTSYKPIKMNINSYPTIGLAFGCFYKSPLENFVIPSGLTLVDDEAFYSCKELTTVEIPESVTKIGWGAFCMCEKLTNVNLPNSLTSLSTSLFGGCISLANITIPSLVTDIGANAFGDCTSLNSITFEGTMVQWNAITKGESWSYNIPATYVQCTDGQVSLV